MDEIKTLAGPAHVYQSTKTFCHNVGLSAAFRQWRAESHCKYLHGYALEIKFTFESRELDVRNWVVDFGSLKSLKTMLEWTFDHKTLVAKDDPLIDEFRRLDLIGLIQMVEVPATGCEAFARMIYESTRIWLEDNGYYPRCNLVEVEVREHGGNSAIYKAFEPVLIQPVIREEVGSQSS
jgi:6-pyruvoyltetrahydropterin/6-carboxytetrahydropterin synthase